MSAKDADPGNIYYRREWLNNEGHHTMAGIFAEVSTSDYLPMFKIWDCYHVVSLWLEYDPTSQESMENQLRKLEIVEQMARETREAMQRAMEHHKTHPVPVKKRRGRRRLRTVAPRQN